MAYKYLIFSLFFLLSAGFHVALAQSEQPVVNSKVILQTTTSWNGTPISYPDGEAEVTALLIEIEPGATTGWHYHPVPSFAYILDGTIEITLEDGDIKTFQKGEAVSEVTNTIHSGKNIGENTLKLIVFYTGTIGTDLTKSENR